MHTFDFAIAEKNFTYIAVASCTNSTKIVDCTAFWSIYKAMRGMQTYLFKLRDTSFMLHLTQNVCCKTKNKLKTFWMSAPTKYTRCKTSVPRTRTHTDTQG